MCFLPVSRLLGLDAVADKVCRSEEDCRGKGDAVLHRGPKLEETRFVDEEKPTWVLCQAMQG